MVFILRYTYTIPNLNLQNIDFSRRGNLPYRVQSTERQVPEIQLRVRQRHATTRYVGERVDSGKGIIMSTKINRVYACMHARTHTHTHTHTRARAHMHIYPILAWLYTAYGLVYNC